MTTNQTITEKTNTTALKAMESVGLIQLSIASGPTKFRLWLTMPYKVIIIMLNTFLCAML